MPWREHGGGYTTKQGGFIRNVPQYEALKAKYGKARAAAITNAHKKKRGPKDDNGASSILVKSAPAAHYRLRKASETARRDRESAFLAGGSVASGATARQQGRTARLEGQASRGLRATAERGYTQTEQRIARHALPATPANKPMRLKVAEMGGTGRTMHTARATDQAAVKAAHASLRAGRRAKGAAGVSLALGGGALAVASRRPRKQPESVSYR